MKLNIKHNRGSYVLLWVGIIVFSFCGVMSKKASYYDAFSITWFAWYGGSLLLLGVYAFIWQQALKIIPLVTAYANRALTTVISIIWGVVFFHESLSLRTLAGVAIIVLGVITVTSEDSERKKE